MNKGLSGMLWKGLATLAAAAVSLAAQGQTVTGAFNPTTAAPSTNSTLRLNYAGFTSNSVGMVLQVYYNSAQLTPGTTTYFNAGTNPVGPGQSQPTGPVTAGTLQSCPGADSFFTLNWVDFGSTWPTPTAGSLADIVFTTAANFSSNALVCWVDDISGGAPARNIVGNATLLPPPPTATIGVSGSPTVDNGSVITFTVTVAPPTGGSLPVNVSSQVTGTMTGVTNTCNGTVTVDAAGTGTCTVSANNTTPFDGPLNVTVTVNAGAGYVLGGQVQATGTITNDDLPTANVAAVPTTLVDAAGNVSTVTVSIGGNAPAGGFAVPLTTTVEDATRATTTCGSQITIPAGASSATCTVTATANTVSGDGNKTVTVAPNCAATCANGTTATVTINDNDVPTVTVVAAPTTLTDSAGQVSTLTFTTSTTSATDITVNLTAPAANPRYSTNCGATVTILANQTTATCTVTAVANTDVGDGSATATVTINSCTTSTTCNVGGAATANVTINDDDKATITIAAAPTPISENGGVSTVTITATAPAGGTLTNGQSVSVVLSGTGTGNTSRYTSTCTSPQVVNFTGAATATATCTITAIDNAVVDGDVTATVTVGANASYTVGNPNAANVVITDDEHGITVTPSVASVTEGQAAVFNLSCGGAVGTVVVNYTVTGADSGNFSSSITLNCPTGGQVTVPTNDDSNIGNARSVTLTIDSLGAGAPAGTVVGTPATATVLVDDNDRPTVIPTLSELGLLTLLLTMAGVAGFALRRKI